MSSKRAIRRRSCHGKLRFGTTTAARNGMKRLVKDKGYQGFMVAYLCKFCGGWHFGHPPSAVRRAINTTKAGRA